MAVPRGESRSRLRANRTAKGSRKISRRRWRFRRGARKGLWGAQSWLRRTFPGPAWTLWKARPQAGLPAPRSHYRIDAERSELNIAAREVLRLGGQPGHLDDLPWITARAFQYFFTELIEIQVAQFEMVGGGLKQ